MTTVTNIPCAQIVPGDNHRQTFDQAKLNELAASIETSGLAQPITVRPNPNFNPGATWDAAGNCTACGEAGRCRCLFFVAILFLALLYQVRTFVQAKIY